MTDVSKAYGNPWQLPPIPQDYDQRSSILAPKQINRLLNFSLACSVFFLCVVFPMQLHRSLTNADSLFGLRVVAVMGDSMEPAIRAGALVMTKETPFDRLAEGDVIVFMQADGRLNTHRIIAIEPHGLITKGDRVLLPDAIPVTREMYRSHVIKVFNGFARVLKVLVD